LRRATECPAGSSPLDDWSAGDEAIDDDDYCDYEQKMDQPSTDVDDEETQNPQDEENYRDGPKHDGILARSELQATRWHVSLA
jgi:hypothetical protein